MKTFGPTINQKKHIDAFWGMHDKRQVDIYLQAQNGKDWIDANIALNMLIAETLDVALPNEEDPAFVAYLKSM